MDYFADISSNNGPTFNAGAYRSGGERPFAVMLKATEGSHYVNPYYRGWAREAHRHGLAVFHYHFARPEDGNPFGQMNLFWDVVHPYFRRPGDYVVIDLESDYPRNGAAWLREADPYLERKAGVHPWCYTFLSYFEEGEVTTRSKEIHIAAWGSGRPGNWRWQLPFGQKLVAWQYTNGVVGPGPHGAAGIPGTCDGSILNPSLARDIKKQLNHRRK